MNEISDSLKNQINRFHARDLVIPKTLSRQWPEGSSTGLANTTSNTRHLQPNCIELTKKRKNITS